MSMHIEGRDENDWGGGDEGRPAEVKSGTSGPSIGLIGFGIVAVLTAVFVLQNRERTTIDFLFFELNSRTWVAIVVAIALGVVLDRLLLFGWRRRKRRKNRS